MVKQSKTDGADVVGVETLHSSGLLLCDEYVCQVGGVQSGSQHFFQFARTPPPGTYSLEKWSFGVFA